MIASLYRDSNASIESRIEDLLGLMTLDEKLAQLGCFWSTAFGKHFLGYALSEGGSNWAPVQLGPRELREVYAEPFATVIRNTGLATIMNSYASVDGLPCAGSPAILTELLRNELGFNGPVVADYASVIQLMEFHHVAATPGRRLGWLCLPDWIWSFLLLSVMASH